MGLDRYRGIWSNCVSGRLMSSVHIRLYTQKFPSESIDDTPDAESDMLRRLM